MDCVKNWKPGWFEMENENVGIDKAVDRFYRGVCKVVGLGSLAVAVGSIGWVCGSQIADDFYLPSSRNTVVEESYQRRYDSRLRELESRRTNHGAVAYGSTAIGLSFLFIGSGGKTRYRKQEAADLK